MTPPFPLPPIRMGSVVNDLLSLMLCVSSSSLNNIPNRLHARVTINGPGRACKSHSAYFCCKTMVIEHFCFSAGEGNSSQCVL